MLKILGLAFVGVALAGCMHSGEIRQAEAGVAACKAQAFKTAVARAQCLNDSAMIAAPAAGSSRDLFNVAMNKRMVLAERVDRKEITQAEADLEMSQTMVSLGSEERSRTAMARAARPVTCTSTRLFGNLQTTCD